MCPGAQYSWRPGNGGASLADAEEFSVGVRLSHDTLDVDLACDKCGAVGRVP